MKEIQTMGTLNDNNNHKIEIVFIPDFEEEALATLKEWEEKEKQIIFKFLYLFHTHLTAQRDILSFS